MKVKGTVLLVWNTVENVAERFDEHFRDDRAFLLIGGEKLGQGFFELTEIRR